MTKHYLFATPTKLRDESPSCVFHRASAEWIALLLCKLFTKEFSGEDGLPAFHHRAAASIAEEDQILLDEAIEMLALYEDPDPGIYDPEPSRHTLFLAQCTSRAEKLEQILRQRSEYGPEHAASESGKGSSAQQPAGDKPFGLSAEESRNSSLILLWLLAQAYYKLLESVISMASWATVLDLPLNQSYLWIVSNIQNLLTNSADLKDFPVTFEPLFPDLYPATIGDLDWEDMVAPDAEHFLSTVQQYIHSKGAHDPPERSPDWVFIELFRPAIDDALQKAEAYNRRVRQFVTQRMRPSGSPVGADTVAKKQEEQAEIAPQSTNRDKVFISYSHKDKKFLDELRAHLKPLERAGRVSAWSDQQIQPGSPWFNEIQKALASTKVAVLLVTKDFLASDFIHENELGPLLKEAEAGGVTIRWVLVRDCIWKKTPLQAIQAAYPTNKPLAKMGTDRDAAWVTICGVIEAAVSGQ